MMDFKDVQPEISPLEKGRQVLYAKPQVVREILKWNAMRQVKTEIMGEYYDAKGRLIALQIAFPERFYNRVAAFCGVPKKSKREITSEERSRLRGQGFSESRSIAQVTPPNLTNKPPLKVRHTIIRVGNND